MGIFDSWKRLDLIDLEKPIKREFTFVRICVIFFATLIGVCIGLISQLDNRTLTLEEKIDKLEKDTVDVNHFNMIEVNGEWFDEDDYNQMSTETDEQK